MTTAIGIILARFFKDNLETYELHAGEAIKNFNADSNTINKILLLNQTSWNGIFAF